MKNSKLLAALILLASVSVCRAGNHVQVTMKNGVAGSTTTADNAYTLDQSALNANNCAVQAVWSPVTSSSPTFTDGTPATGTITLVNNNIIASSATNSITVAATSVWQAAKATDSITIASTSLLNQTVIINGASIKFGVDVATATTSSATANNLANYINQNFAVMTATWNGGSSAVVNATATVAGTGGNLFTLATSTPAAITFASAKFTGGQNNLLDAATLSIDNLVSHSGVEWSDLTTASDTAISIAQWLQRNSVFVSTCVTGQLVVNSTVGVAGAAGNLHTITTNVPMLLTIGSTNYINGNDNAAIKIGTITYTVGTDFAQGAAAANTATSIASTITARSVQACQASGSVVTCTGTVSGTNYAWSVSTTNVTLLPTTSMLGATSSAINSAADSITIPNHNLGLAQGVWFQSVTGSAPGGLGNGTTYFVMLVDANTVKLSTSAQQASAGTVIDITTQAVAGNSSYKLNTATLAGTPVLTPLASNDGTNYTDVTSTNNFQSPYSNASANIAGTWRATTMSSSGSVIYDFSGFNLSKLLRFQVGGITAGGLSIKLNADCTLSQ